MNIWILRVLMCVALVGLFCLTAQAATGDVIASGYCGGEGDGTNLTWTMFGNGELVISGSGIMADGAPWSSKRDGIKTVLIEDGVTSIGHSAFYDSPNLFSVIMGESVVDIGDCAFAWCTKLSNIVFSNRVNKIGSSAFYWCASLTSVTIPDTVTSIGDSAFYDCDKLTEIIVDSKNAQYSSLDGVLFNKNKTCLLQYPAGKEGASYDIPDSVTCIGGSAFSGCGLSDIAIPESVTDIGAFSFGGCNSLVSITIPHSVSNIGNRAFARSFSLSNIFVDEKNTAYSSLDGILFNKKQTTLIQYPMAKTGATYSIPQSVTCVGSWAFDCCNNLTTVVIPEGVTEICEEAFTVCENLTAIAIPNSVESIGGYVFAGCDSLATVTIGSGVISIGDWAFNNCSDLVRVEFVGNVPPEVGTKVFANCADELTHYYHEGTTGWMDSEHYDAEAGTWCGCPLVMIPAEDSYELTRGKLCILLVDTIGLADADVSKLDNPYKDVLSTDEFYEAVLVCTELGIVGGYGDGRFYPRDKITREQYAVLLWNMAGKPSSGKADLSAYGGEYSAWAENGLSWAIGNGVMWADDDGSLRATEVAYSDDADLSLVSPTKVVDTAVSLDLAIGTIKIESNQFYTQYSQGETIQRTTSKNCIIRQRTTTPTSNTITVSSGEVNMTLAGVNISSDSGSPISVGNGARLVLTLVGDNTLTATDSGAGLRVSDEAELTIQGGGSLYATGGNDGAGIGGSRGGSGGTITINSGTIDAKGGDTGGAGIGGGYCGNGGSITINGGTVTATSCGAGAGVGGGGYGNSYGIITINGGVIKATGGSGTYDGSGIGGGNSDGGGRITIKGATIIATASSRAGTGIGGGPGETGGTIIISDAHVTATGGYHAIGGGRPDNEYGCDSITISKSTLNLSYTHSDGAEYQERIFDLELTDAVAALSGSTLTMTTVARGASGLTYQWQSSTDNSNWTNVAGQTSATLSIPMTAELDKTYFRCKLTNGFGNVAYTNLARAYVLAFEKQPTPVEVGVGDYAALEAKATCANVTYHWERSYDNGISWNAVPGEIYSSLLGNPALSENGALYRCVITATNGDKLASNAVPITVNTDDVTYTVKYYHQLPDGSGYGAAEQAVQVGVPNSAVTAPERTFEGFVENTAKGTVSGTVATDGSLVLSRYYDRKEYSITFDMMGGSALPALAARYGAAVTAPADPVRYGYDFGGWYANAALTTPYTFTTMPLNGTTVYAKWVSKDEGREIEYQINSILFRDADSYGTLDSIPDGDFLVETSVTNLSSTHMDTVLFVSYDKDGRMLGFHYAFANPAIGQTMTFGTAIDNEEGQVATVKVMILSNLAGARPLAKVLETR